MTFPVDVTPEHDKCPGTGTVEVKEAVWGPHAPVELAAEVPSLATGSPRSRGTGVGKDLKELLAVCLGCLPKQLEILCPASISHKNI